MVYTVQKTIDLPVDAEFGEGLWIRIIHPKSLTWRDQKGILAAQRRKDADGNLDPDAIDEIMRILILDWNLPPLDGSVPITPIPAKDPEALSKVPGDAVIPVVLGALPKAKAASPDPNSSSASASTSEADAPAGI